MKKTIAKAWTDARTGKTADPLSSYRWATDIGLDAQFLFLESDMLHLISWFNLMLWNEYLV
jgi:hypothetical protein